MQMQSAALLALDGAIDRVNSAKDAAHCHGIATERVGAGALRLRAVGTAAAKAHPEEMPEGQQDQGLKAFGARQGITRQQGLALLVVRQFLAAAI